MCALLRALALENADYAEDADYAKKADYAEDANYAENADYTENTNYALSFISSSSNFERSSVNLHERLSMALPERTLVMT